jgi:hypothetical protein
MTFAHEKCKGEPPLPPGQLALFDECLAVLDQDPTGQIDPHCRQGFSNVPTMIR